MPKCDPRVVINLSWLSSRRSDISVVIELISSLVTFLLNSYSMIGEFFYCSRKYLASFLSYFLSHKVHVTEFFFFIILSNRKWKKNYHESHDLLKQNKWQKQHLFFCHNKRTHRMSPSPNVMYINIIWQNHEWNGTAEGVVHS